MSKIHKSKKFIQTLVIFLLLVGMFAAVASYLAKPTTAAWYQESWGFRKKLTIDHTKVSGGADLTSFPILVSLTDGNLASKAQTTGNDIVFTASDGLTKLDHEIEKFDRSTGQLVAWVRIPTLHYATDDIIYMYYGNFSAPSQQNKTGVWDANYIAVYHLSETTGHHLNSTGTTGLNSTSEVISKMGSATGKADGADEFGSASDVFKVTDNSSLRQNGDMTIETWVKNNTIGKDSDGRPIYEGTGVDPWASYEIWLKGATDNNRAQFTWYNNSGSPFTVNTSTSLLANTWYYIAGIKSSNSILLYLNGAINQSAGSPTTSGTIFNTSPDSFCVGSSCAENSPVDGVVDEVRYSNSARPAGWVATTYNTINNNAAFFSAKGNEEKSKGPVLYFGFDEGSGTTTNDSSPNLLVGSFAGTTKPTWQTDDQCVSGKCLYFAGTDDYVSIPDTSVTKPQTNMSISLWFKLNELPSTRNEDAHFAWKTHNVSPWYSYDLNVQKSDNKIHFTWVNSGSTGFVALGKTIPAINQWYHLEVVKDTSTMKIYLNGVDDTQSSETPTGTIYDSNNALLLSTSASGAKRLHGFIDEFKLYDYARTAVQVRSDAVRGNTKSGNSASFGKTPTDALNNGLAGYWKMDEATWSGTLAEVKDSSGNDNNGQAQGATGAKAYPRAGKFGNGGYFDGVDDYISVPSNYSFQIAGNITVSTWLNTSNTTTGSHEILSLRTAGGAAQYVLTQINRTIQMTFGLSGGNIQPSQTNAVNTGTWYHLVGVLNGTTGKLYINGVEVASVDGTGTLQTTAQPLYLGTSLGTSNLFNGSMDEVRIYNRALSPTEVTQLYNWAPGPIVWWKLDENSGTTAYDSSGNNNVGSITSGNWSTGKYGSALTLDGVNTSFENTTLDNTNFPQTAGTIEFWAYGNFSTQDLNTLFDDYDTTRNHIFIRSYSSGMPSANIQIVAQKSDSTYIGDSEFSVKDNQWNHIAVTYDTVTGLFLTYLNGSYNSKYARGTSGKDVISDPSWVPNGEDVSISKNIKKFNGLMDDVRIYNYARTPAQIVQDMNAGHPAPGSPVGSAFTHWDFDEGNGTTAHDLTSNGKNLTLSSATSWSLSGKWGKAWHGGSGQYLTRAGDTSFNFLASDNFTLSAWFNSDSTTNPAGSQMIFDKDNGPGYGVYFNTSGQIQFAIGDAGHNFPQDLLVSQADVYDHTWHMVTVIKNGANNTKLYVDGQLQSTDTSLTASSDLTNADDFKVGSGYAGVSPTNFIGLIDDAYIFRSALTEDQIKLLYNQGKTDIMGSLSDTSKLTGGSVASNSASAKYCVPGSSDPCNPPLGEWKFNENTGTTVSDSSSKGNNGSFSGSPTWITGKIGGAINFTDSGSNNCVSVPDSNSLHFYNAISISTWIKDNTLGQSIGNDDIFTKLSGGSDQWAMGFDTHKPCFRYYTFPASTHTYCMTSAITTGVWHNLAVSYTFGTASSMHMYVDGQEQPGTWVAGTGNTAMSTYNTNTINFAGYGSCTSGQSAIAVDDTKLYDYTRTPSQIAWDYNQGAPVAWYQFNECLGTIAHNSAINANGVAAGMDGTITPNSGRTAGTCGSGTSSEMWNGGTIGKYGASLKYDGTGDYVRISDSPSLDLNLTNFSVSLWANVNNENSWRFLLGKQLDDGTDGSYGIYLNNSSPHKYIQFRVWTDTANSSITSDSVIPLGTWVHLIGTWDGAKLRFYVDGNLQSSVPNLSGSHIKDTANDLTIATSSNLGATNFLDGQIDDVRIYNYALTATQIKLLYNRNSAVQF